MSTIKHIPFALCLTCAFSCVEGMMLSPVLRHHHWAYVPWVLFNMALGWCSSTIDNRRATRRHHLVWDWKQ